MNKPMYRIITVFILNILTTFTLFFVLDLKKYLGTENLFLYGMVSIGGSLFQIIPLLLFYKLVDKQSFRNLGLRFSKKDFLFSIITISLTIGLFLLYLSNTASISGRWDFSVFTSIKFYLMFLLIGIAWFFAAFSEELLYRGYLVVNLKHLSLKKLYLVTSIFFMLSHVFIGLSPIYALFLLASGCTLLYLYLKTNSIFPVTFVHLGYNFCANHLVGTSDIAVYKFNEDPSIVHLILITLIFNLITIVLVRLFYKGKQKTDMLAPTNYRMQI